MFVRIVGKVGSRLEKSIKKISMHVWDDIESLYKIVWDCELLYLVMKCDFTTITDTGCIWLEKSLMELEKVIKHFEKRVWRWIKNIRKWKVFEVAEVSNIVYRNID